MRPEGRAGFYDASLIFNDYSGFVCCADLYFQGTKSDRRRPRAISIAGELSDRARKIRNTFLSAEVLLESFFHLSLIRNGKLGQLSKFA